jgi:hypothetical protein
VLDGRSDYNWCLHSWIFADMVEIEDLTPG